MIEAPARPTGRNYVGGEWRASSSGATYTKQNPMRPAEAVGEFSASTEADAADAVAAAAGGFDAWAALLIGAIIWTSIFRDSRSAATSDWST